MRTYEENVIPNFDELKCFFGEVNWNDIKEFNEVKKVCRPFLNMSEVGVKQFVPIYKIREEIRNY